jgi:flagellar basal-body rod protein FlgF
LIRGMYTAAMGMLNDMYKLNRISNDLANVDTPGYKQGRETFRTYLEGLMTAELPDPIRGRKLLPIGKLEGAVVLDEVKISMKQGSLEKTGNPLDLALEGSGFFAVLKNGKVFYTRAGNFKIDQSGYMVTPDGAYLLDENGEKIKIKEELLVAEDGKVFDGGKYLTRIAIYGFKKPEKLEKIGYTYFKPTEYSGDPEKVRVGILQGYIERSNVNVIRGMVGMINALRHFETAQRVITSSDELLGRLINNVGSLR